MFSPTLKTNSSGTHGMSRLPQNLTNATALFSTSIDHCLDHFESLEFAQAQLREKSHFTSLFSSQSAVFALCHVIRASLRGRLTKRTSQSGSNVCNISKKQLGDLSHLIDGTGN